MRSRTMLIAALALMCAPMSAEVELNDVSEVMMGVYIPCTGHVVQLSGPLHTLITLTTNGKRIGGKQHFQPQGISGMDTTTGEKYQATGVTQSRFEGTLEAGQYTYTYVNNFRIIGQGPGNNYLVHVTTHVTIRASGELTVDHENFSSDCI